MPLIGSNAQLPELSSTVNSRIDFACLCLPGAGPSSPSPYNLYRLSDLLLFLLRLWSPVDLCLTRSLSCRAFLS